MSQNAALPVIGSPQATVNLRALTECLIERAPVGQAVTDVHGAVIWANSAMRTLLGSAGHEAAGLFHSYVLNAADQADIQQDSARLVRGETDSSVKDYQWQVPGGPLMWVRVQSTLAVADTGQLLQSGDPSQPCLVRQLSDVTTAKAAEIERAKAFALLEQRNVDLERSNQELVQFAYVASHDLSEPLRVIAGHVELLARRYAGQLDENADRYIEFAVDGCTRMRTLIEDLLRYSRAGSELRLQPVDFDELVNALIADLSQALTAAGGTVSVAGTLPATQADPSQMRQLLSNLISNSLKYAHAAKPARIGISAERDHDRWVFRVADNGIGIPPNQRTRIFQIFQRLHGREIPGTGIGLAICRKVVEQHGGSIWVTENPNGGAVFWFTLPDDAAGAIA